jgi:hypothetical protein
MSDIDAVAGGILIESGADVPTALAGSVIEEPVRPRPVRKLSRSAFWLAVAAGIESSNGQPGKLPRPRGPS